MPEQPRDLRQVDWNDLYPRLLLAAMIMVKGRPNAKDLAMDLAHEAIMKTLAGKRPWNPSETTPFAHLCGVIKSDLSHRDKLYEAINSQPLDDDIVVKLADYRPTPEEISLYRSQERHLLDYIGQRNQRAQILAHFALSCGLTKSKEFSEAMNIPVTQVEHIRKSLKNLVSDYKNLHGSASDSPAARVLTKVSGGNNDR